MQAREKAPQAQEASPDGSGQGSHSCGLFPEASPGPALSLCTRSPPAAPAPPPGPFPAQQVWRRPLLPEPARSHVRAVSAAGALVLGTEKQLSSPWEQGREDGVLQQATARVQGVQTEPDSIKK